MMPLLKWSAILDENEPAINPWRSIAYDDIAQRLGSTRDKISQIAEFLTKTGLLIRKNGAFSVAAKSIHLPGSSPLVGRHHLNWRFRAMSSIANASEEDLASSIHYSSVFTLRKSDAEKIRAIVNQAILTTKQVIKESEHEEDAFVLCVDFFTL